MQPETNVQEQEHLFSEEDIFQFEEASTGQRFLNMLIDGLLMNFGLSFLTGGIVGYLLGVLFPDFAISLFADEDSSGALWFGIILAYFNDIVYYTFCEKVFKGYTLGKLITGTRAIRTDGGELTLKNAFLRTVCRLVPFEPFSIWFGDGLWHDRWTKTMVIKTR
jgi:uncharacterized RDD family membrane protein YckC